MNQLFKEKYPSAKELTLRKPRILVAPLDWGLGHTTRCIPIIHELLRQGCEVWLAGEKAQQIVLNKEFPDLPFLQLKGYRIRYAKTALGLLKNILFQTPKILKTIKYENAWLKKTVNEYNIDVVISDNRFGLYHSEISSIFITHQLTIKTSLGKWAEKYLQKKITGISTAFLNAGFLMKKGKTIWQENYHIPKKNQ